MKRVGYAVAGECAQSGIAEYHLFGGVGRRIAAIGGLGVGCQKSAHVGQLLYELHGETFGARGGFLHVRRCAAFGFEA